MARELMSKRILNAEQRAALGAVVAESAYLEHLIEKTIEYLARMRAGELEILVSKNIMLGAKINILEGLALKRVKSKRRKEKLLSLTKRMKDNNTERRNAVHGIWWHTEAVGIINRAMGVTGEPEAKHSSGGKISAKAMMGLADKISATNRDLLVFSIENWLAPARARRLRKALSKSEQSPPTR